MRKWVPSNPPSNRDRLELYALHKQAAAGDCEVDKPTNKGAAEKAKWQAWKTKAGLSQAEAMSRYITECDRQIRVYGSKSGPSTSTMETSTPDVTATSPPAENPNTPPTTLLKGIDSVPLLATAASEPQTSYMQRLAIMNANQSWWRGQSPLCSNSTAEPSFSSKIESVIISIGAFFERQALAGHSIGPITPTSIHAAVYPIHVLLLTYWIVIVYLLTIPTTFYLVVKTMLLGSNSTGVTLSQLIEYTITPTSTTASMIMNDTKHSLPPRAVGLALTPLCIITDVTISTYAVAGDIPGALMYCFGVLITWWYWVFVLPWLSIAMGWVGVAYSGCCAIVETAGL